MMEAATLMLNDSTNPLMGTTAQQSAASTASCETPAPGTFAFPPTFTFLFLSSFIQAGLRGERKGEGEPLGRGEGAPGEPLGPPFSPALTCGLVAEQHSGRSRPVHVGDVNRVLAEVCHHNLEARRLGVLEAVCRAAPRHHVQPLVRAC
mmetsp:Transcript_1994/g.4702  ORF Transcript_1994/g.4702 Transcript_1994/m.4702 type:complete len:149 (+) Transcript_1994:359-805(+)